MIDFTAPDLERYLVDDAGGPVVMLNLLRFRPDGGRERYGDYVSALGPVFARYGAEVVYAGTGGAALVASGQDWDLVALVRYPSRKAFGDMVRDPEYRASAHLRTEALTDSVLQPTVPVSV